MHAQPLPLFVHVIDCWPGEKRLRDNYKFGSFEFACRLAARLGAGVGETNFIF